MYRRPESDQTLPDIPSTTYVCHYSMDFGVDSRDQGKVDVTPFTGENDEWSDAVATPTLPQPKRSRTSSSSRLISTEGLQSNDTPSTTSSNSESSDDMMGGATFQEGTTEQRDIRVGKEHQANVPPFVPNQRVVNRKPTLVWKRGKITQPEMAKFFQRVSEILTPYLRDKRLTHEEPYSPLPWDVMERTVHSRGSTTMPTLSSICTAFTLSQTKADLLREYDVDAILTVLHENNYDVEDALDAIESSPSDFLTVWPRQEKELFNSGFRRYSGSLRMICKGIASSKDFHDVIDYHYRFKIPDQFRRFQDIKQEQAIRMMECIETRRNVHSTIPINTERNAASESLVNRKKEGGW